MKTKNIGLLFGLACIGLMGCKDDLIGQQTVTVTEGDEIQFGASGAFDVDAKSRTEYGDLVDGKYPIYWTAGDQVSIYCAEAGGSGGTFSTYTVTPSTTDGTYGSVQKTNDTGLQWGDPTVEHQFYAFYPQSRLNTAETTGHTIVAEVPTFQNITVRRNDNPDTQATEPYVVTPDMTCAMMGARTYVNPSSPDFQGTVSLDFKPFVTALDVVIRGPESSATPLPITQLNIFTDSNVPIAGDFTCDLDKLMDYYANPATADNPCTYPQSSEVRNMITVGLRTEDDEPVELGQGQEITVTVFLLPHRDYSNVTFNVSVENAAAHSNTLTSDMATIPAMKKSVIRLSNLTINDVNRWMGSLDGNIYISELSIPGTAVSASGVASQTDNGGMDMVSQRSTLEQQFNLGIRYFDFPCVYTKGIGGLSANEPMPLVSGGDFIDRNNQTLENAMTQLAGLVAANPTEFIYVVPYFQPISQSGWGESATFNDSDLHYWLDVLRDYMNGLSDGANGNKYIATSQGNVEIVSQFTNDMTIDDVRGKILLFIRNPYSWDHKDSEIFAPVYGFAARPTSEFHASGIIYNWNADKNRWGARGGSYDWTVSGNTQTSPATNNTYVPTNWGGTDNLYRVANYNEVLPAHTYIMDWPRVSNGNQTYSYDGITYNWLDSKAEKLNLLKAHLNACITDENIGHRFYLTSLDGFYVIDNSESFLPDRGQGGDMVQYAHDINYEMSDYILNSLSEYGSLGIVIMDYAGTEEYEGTRVYGERIPQVVIDNNFRFALDKRPSGGN